MVLPCDLSAVVILSYSSVIEFPLRSQESLSRHDETGSSAHGTLTQKSGTIPNRPIQCWEHGPIVEILHPHWSEKEPRHYLTTTKKYIQGKTKKRKVRAVFVTN